MKPIPDHKEKVLSLLKALDIPFEIHEHPPVTTVEEALPYWQKIHATHCKNLFFRNHKGNRHYLVILRHDRRLDIRDLEQRLGQGKITFASPRRMEHYLGLTGGSVSVFGLINDTENHVHLFIDAGLESASRISFHPNDNKATVVISRDSFRRFLGWTGNTHEFIKLYDE
ncbi:MAG TPA: prolyl-tRNA synthetase associated domain-containing protein [Bacteroides sp.]|nr:prolyl-tRNA synthetase associated domain-containing protein [Bacteroides sp.]